MGARAEARYWIWRPIKGVFNLLSHYSAILIAGGLASFPLHSALEMRAVSGVLGKWGIISTTMQIQLLLFWCLASFYLLFH